MKLQKLLLAGLIILQTSGALHADWLPMHTIKGSQPVKFNFMNDQTGYALTFKDQKLSIRKTKDSGGSWTAVPLPVNSGQLFLRQMHFYADGKGAVAYNSSDFGAVQRTRIYHTTDNGQTWKDITPDTTRYTSDPAIHFIDDQTGYFSIHGKLYKTDDGGATWSVFDIADVSASKYYQITSIDFTDKDHGTLGFWDGSFLYAGGMFSTTDGGKTWREIYLNEYESAIKKVVQTSAGTAYASRQRSSASKSLKLYKTTNSGQIWDTIFLPNSVDKATLADFDFKDDNNGMIVIESMGTLKQYVYWTSNGGVTWTEFGNFEGIYGQYLELTTNSAYVAGNNDLFFKLQPGYQPTGLADDDLGPSVLRIFPNPVRPGSAIYWSGEADVQEIRIYEITGQEISRQAIVSANRYFLPELPKGMYVVALRNEEQIFTERIVVE